MKRLKKIVLPRLHTGESGNALILVLIFLVLGSLTLVPTLTHIGTALKTGEIYEESTNEIYTADSGIDDGLWRIKYDFMGTDYNPYDFETEFPYETEDLNGMAANFTIQNIWFPSDVQITDPSEPGYIDMSPEETKAMIESGKLVVIGTAGATSLQPFHIKIEYTPDFGENLTVKSLGVWLPQGFEYITDNCSLFDGGFAEECYPDDIVTAEAPGGTTVVWSYDEPYPLFTDFVYDPENPEVLDEIPLSFNFDFGYTLPPGVTKPPLAVAWITTDMESGALGYPVDNPVPVSWDVDTRYYRIISTAGDTMVETHSSKSEMRQMGDAMSGDYVAIGGSLLSDDLHPWGDMGKRETWHRPSSFDLNDPTDNVSIPDNADAVYAFLYWSGWRSEGDKIFHDYCSDFNDWDLSQTADSQTRVPTGDGDIRGTWDTSPCWDDVDETTPDDDDYMTGVATVGSGPNRSAYKLFDFSAFSVPDGSYIQDLTVYIRVEDASSGTNNIMPYIKVGGSFYSGDSIDPGSDWTTYSYTWDENPRSHSSWTADDINGSGWNALQRFGVYSTDLDPDVLVSMVYTKVNYFKTCWSISSGQFHGQGSSSAGQPEKTITLKNSMDLSEYASKPPGSVGVAWFQSISGTFEDDDTLYIAFSGNDGDSWSQNYEVFSGNNPGGHYWSAIPYTYLTGEFKFRLYFDGDHSAEYVYLDNISLLPIDTEITFKIGDDQVYFDGSDPETGEEPLGAGRSYAMLNTMPSETHTSDYRYGYSYACVRDVSMLVRTFPENAGEEHHTGNALYTIDGVDADTFLNGISGDISDFAYAGWSLIIVYACPETAGHYIYIRDDNFAFHPGESTPYSLDFDQDGTEGGIISNFVIPEPLRDADGNIRYPVAAKITCFVVEGDNFSNDTSSLRITGQLSEKSMELWNPSSPYPDVFNSQSYPGTYNEGVDIDTFEVKWSDTVGGVPILTPGDKKLYVDMFSKGDAWNLVYFIISIQSETTTSGTTHYEIHSN